MAIDQKTVAKVAKLARIHIDEKDLAPLEGRLNGILSWIAMLEEVDTQKVEPMFSVHLDAAPERHDAVTVGNIVSDVLANAPEKELDMFVVPKVIG